jgi:hypothetical protein
VGVADKSDLLTGDWLGTYYYPARFKPVTFEASLIEFDGIDTGTTSEIAGVGDDAGQKLQGHLDGERAGKAVHFSKVYVGAADQHRSEILYAGAVHDEGTRIEGTWTIPGNWSGVFKMTRIKQKQAWFRHRWWFEKTPV